MIENKYLINLLEFSSNPILLFIYPNTSYVPHNINKYVAHSHNQLHG